MALPIDQIGAFECSDEVFNRIWQSGLEAFSKIRTWRDCRGDWHQTRLVSLAFGRLTRDPAIQTDSLLNRKPHGDLSDEHLYWLLAAWDCYQATADAKLAAVLYPIVKRVADLLSGSCDARGLARTGQPGVAATNILCVGALRAACGIAAAMADAQCEARYEGLAGSICKAVNNRLWNEGRGLYIDGPDETVARELSNSLAIVFAVAPRLHWTSMLLRLFDEKTPDLLHSGAAWEIFYLLRALYDAGDAPLADRLMRRYWDGGHFAQPGEFLPLLHMLSTESLGVDAVQPGYRTVRVAPRASGLEWAKGAVPTPRGALVVDWQKGKDDRSFRLEVGLPPGTVGLVGIPRLKMKHPRLVVNDDVIWSNEKLHPNEQVSTITLDDGHIWIDVGKQGSCRFEMGG